MLRNATKIRAKKRRGRKVASAGPCDTLALGWQQQEALVRHRPFTNQGGETGERWLREGGPPRLLGQRISGGQGLFVSRGELGGAGRGTIRDTGAARARHDYDRDTKNDE